MNYHKAILLILDGWGIGRKDYSDAIFAANTPFIDNLLATQPNTTLKTFGQNVGLPNGQMGNSEVGHLNIGAGRIVYQMLVLINKSFADKSILNISAFKKLIDLAKSENKNIHLIGLVSNGGVHSSDEHLKELCGILKDNNLDNQTFIHAFLDGRDCDPHSGKGFIKEVLNDPRLGNAKLASIIGRYYAMDRDKRWERVKRAYDAMVHGIGKPTNDVLSAIAESYQNGVSDEFMLPIINTENNQPIATIKDGDIVLCFNFRTDRGREISMALTQQSFHEQNMAPLNLHYFTMTEYDKTFKNVEVIFDKQDLKLTLGEHLSNLGLKQIRAAETEKYPHVTFFFSGGRELEFEGEQRILVNSPKVATYDLQPEMSAIELKEKVKAAIETNQHDFFCVNFANPDMVGHTGVFEAIKKACETVDGCVKELVETAQKNDYRLMIIADHGNADFAINDDGTPNTAHSLNLVPCIVLGEKNISLKEGILADVAPTLLKMMGLQQPDEMTGNCIF
ncbi:MAG: 2,3-bisphosphoglycerate-independent phosphoglycerate mutase [Flavobacteriales bacterium]|nr:2,3-bisphosphoglycerate-independent phosphoglycerate mutase [Flavobacteriales bacterium]